MSTRYEKAMRFICEKIISWKLKQGFGLDEKDVYSTLGLKVPKHLSKEGGGLNWGEIAKEYGIVCN